jgi:hypothetical protein
MKPPEPSSPFLPLRLPHRARREELIDRPDVDPDLLARSLREVSRVNVWLGGLRSLRDGVLSLAGSRRRISLLDVGVGSGALARRLAGVDQGQRGARQRRVILRLRMWSSASHGPRLPDRCVTSPCDPDSYPLY